MSLLRQLRIGFKTQRKMGWFTHFGGTFQIGVFAYVLLVSGCGPNPFDDSSRLEVNDHLMVACSGWMETDIQLETALSLAEDARLQGLTKSNLLQSVTPTCAAGTADANTACWICNTAILDQVFGD